LSDDLGEWTRPVADFSQLVAQLTQLRDAAKLSKDFAAVDEMKQALADCGVEVRMSKAGVELLAGPQFDVAKFEALQ